MSQTPSQQELLSALQKSAAVIQKQEKALAAYHEPIAIISMGCRYPGGSDTPERFWQNLLNGFDAIIDLPANREKDLIRSRIGQNATTLRGGYLPQVDGFDAHFFGLSPREVLVMDPAHRLLLETSWQALEDANLVPDQLFNTEVGVFVGGGVSGYLPFDAVQSSDLYLSTGNVASTAAGRISYLLGLTGPCVAVDTACSSSLTAIHLACQSLRNGECTAAIAGGVSLILDEAVTAIFTNSHMLADDAHCKTFDASANGYVRGEGCGLVVLKRLSAAHADGDTVLAVIRGTAINQDGPSGGLTVPNGPSQERVIRRALHDAGLKPEQIGYVEAHGTGTPLGDPIEIGALSAVFGSRASPNDKGRSTPLYVGSVKTNIGHLEMAAGVAGLMKLVLALQHGQIPPQLHLHTPNPRIDWATSPVQVPTTVTPWLPPTPAQELIGGVSSFGFSGTNAHVIVAEAGRGDKETRRQGDRERGRQGEGETGRQGDRSYHLLTFSGKNEQALQAYAQSYQDFLTAHPEVDLGDLCYTSHIGRSHFAHRLGIAGNSVAQLQDKLNTYLQGESGAGLCQGMVAAQQKAAKVAFLFTGQGSQYVGMGRELYETQPAFRATLDRCDRVLQECLGRSLIELLYPATAPDHNDLLDSHPCGQASNFAIECALADLWRSWGIQPDIVLGHSLGDFAAAYTAGVLSLEDGLRLVTERGRLMERAVGSMVAVMASEAEVLPFCAAFADVTIGVINGPRSVVFSGGHANVALITAQLQAAGFKTRKLDIPVAAHSPMLDPVLAAFEAAVQRVNLSAPKLPVISSMTGKPVTVELTDPTYWRRHLRNTVRFAEGVQTLHEQGVGIFLEIGPKPTLLGMAEQCLDKENGSPPLPLSPSPCLFLPSLRAGHSDWQQLLESLGALYGQGVKIDWGGFDRDYQRRKVVLPTYPFQRQRYWVEQSKTQRAPTLRPLIDKMTRLPLHNETVFEAEFSVAVLPFLADHRVYDTVISPAACQLTMVLSAAELTFGQQQPLQLADVILPQALVMPNATDGTGTRTVQAVFTPFAANGAADSSPQQAFKLISFAAGSLQHGQNVTPATHATGYAARLAHGQPALVDLAVLRQRCTQPVDIAAFYTRMAATQIALGPSFRWLAAVWQGATSTTPEALAKVVIPAAIGTISGYPLHPGLLDACFQVAGMPSVSHESAAAQPTLLPFAVEAVQFYGAIQGASSEQEWWCHARQTSAAKWDIQLLDGLGNLLLVVKGFEQRAAEPAAIQGAQLRSDWLHTLQWARTPGVDTLARAASPACWLVFGDESAFTQALVARLVAPGTPTVLVTAGDAYTITPAEGIDQWQQATVDPQNPATFQQLLATVAAQHSSVGVVYLWGMTDTAATCAIPERTLAQCNHLLHLVQALAATTLVVKLWLVTQDCQMIDSEQNPAQHRQLTDTHDAVWIGERAAAGALWGFARTIAQEFPAFDCTCIDLAAAEPTANAAIVQQEMLTVRDSGHEPLAGQIAYREGVRYAARLTAWDGSALPAGKAISLSAEASYLITGGLGGLGLQVAQQLIAGGAKQLVLSGRQGATTPATQATLAQWRADGVTVQVVQADMARLEDVQQLLIECEALAPLRGIVHAAGVLDDGVLAQQSPARFAKVMQSKVQGTWHLHTLTAHHDLDFFVCFSSLAALLGTPGQSNYAAANAFMDTLMQQRRVAGLPGSSIQWGPWAEVGLAAHLRDRLQAQGMGMIAPAQGRALFQALLRQTPIQVGVIPAKVSALGVILPNRQHAAQASAALATPRLREQLQAATGGERSALLERYLRAEIAQVLRLPAHIQIGQDDQLFQLGFDSLMAVELKNRVQAALGATLRSTLLFDYPTLAALTRYLDKLTGDAQGEPMALPLIKADRTQPLPLSFAQQRLWFNQTSNRANSYNIIAPFRLEGKLDLAVLEQSLTALLERHEVLRTVFPAVAGTPVQVIMDVQPIKLAPIDLQSLATAEQAAALEQLIQQEVQHIYDLAEGLLFHVVLAKLADKCHFLLFSFNHILIDAGSLAQILNELGLLYHAFVTSSPSPLAPLTLQYADYAAWQRHNLTPAITASRVQYWVERLTRATPLFELYSDKPRPAKETFRGGTLPFQTTLAQTQQLQALQKASGATLFSSVLAAWAALLYRYGQGEELVVGAPFANRTHQEMDGVIGHWASMLILPLRFQANPTFLALIQQTNQATQTAMANDVPIDQLVQALPAAHKRNNLPHQFLIRYLPGNITLDLQPAGVTVIPLANKTSMLRPDLALTVLEDKSADGIRLIGEWEYKLELFEEASICRMMEDFYSLLDALIADPTAGIDAVTLPNLVQRKVK